jgi:hypothetical protein
MRCHYQRMRDLTIYAGNRDVQTGLQDVAVIAEAEIHLRIDRKIRRQRDIHLAGRNPHGPLKACRPTGGEQLLRIGAVTDRAWWRQ